MIEYPEYFVEIEPSIKAKITSFQKASEEYAFIGSAPKEDRDDIEHHLAWSRYALERTIATFVGRKRKHDIHVEALAEIKALIDQGGMGDDRLNMIKDIVYGALKEIKEKE